MNKKNIKKIFTLGTLGTVIVSSFINVHAESDILNDEYSNEDVIIQDKTEKELIMEVLVENDLKIDSKKPRVEFKTLNCTNVKIKSIIGEIIADKQLDNNMDEWVESYLDIPIEFLDSKMFIEFENSISGERMRLDINVLKPKETNSLIIKTQKITTESKNISGEFFGEYDEIYALIGEKKFDASMDKLKNEFNIDIKGQKIGDEVQIYAKVQNEDVSIIRKLTVESINFNESVIVDNEISDNNEKNKEDLKGNLNKGKLEIKKMELSDISSKFKGITYPNALVKVEINGFTMKSYADDEGKFEIDLYYKRKTNTKVKIVLSHEDFENNKTIITYVEDKKAPKNPYLKGSIKEGSTSVHGKSEIGSKILVKIYEPTHKVVEKVINVRHTPTKKAINKIGRLIKGTNVVVLEHLNDWSKIQFKKSIAYVKTEELTKISESEIKLYEGYTDNKGNFNIPIDSQTQGATIKIMAEDDNKNKSDYTVTTVEKNN